MSDYRYQIEISLHTVIHTLLCRSTSLIPKGVSLKLPDIMEFHTSNLPIITSSGLVPQFTDLSQTQTSVVILGRSLYYFNLSLWTAFRIWETLSTDSPQLVFEITGIYPWRVLTTSQLFNRLDRYLRPKSLQKMGMEERVNLVIILQLVLIGVCSTPLPTGKTPQESLDSLKQALQAYICHITPDIPLSDSQPNYGTSTTTGLYRNWKYKWCIRTRITDVEVSQIVSEYFCKEYCPERNLDVALVVLPFREYIAGSDGV